jgi:hypothetical protein
MWERLFRLVRHLPARRIVDPDYYLHKYPDVAAVRAGPARHYLEFGAAEGRKPHRLFDPAYYLRRNPSIPGAASPILHFLKTGGRSGMSPHPLFDCEAYLDAVPELRGENPMVEFIRGTHPKPPAREGSQFGCGL